MREDWFILPPLFLLEVIVEKFVEIEPKSLTYLKSSSLQMAQWYFDYFLKPNRHMIQYSLAP